jgi:hypothetical protein
MPLMLIEGFINLAKFEVSSELQASSLYSSTHRIAGWMSPRINLGTAVPKRKVWPPSQGS